MTIPENNPLIVGVGFQKTGTSTLREALRILGFKVKDTSTRPLIPILRGQWSRVMAMLRHVDAVEDTPWYMIYKELDRMAPGSKFILTIRDEEAWYQSVSTHIGGLRNPHHEWIYGRGKGLPRDDKENTIRVYREHNRNVRNYFKDRPGDLLVLDFTNGDQWEKLCAFLNKDIPDTPFPHANKTPGRKKSTRKPLTVKRCRKHVKYWLKIKYIDLLNLWENESPPESVR